MSSDVDSIPLPHGFRFAGVASGIKASGKHDVSIVVTDAPAVAAAVTTTNQIVAAPVLLCRERTPTDRFRAVITNSGNANACTGEQGVRDAAEMTQRVSEKLACDTEQVLVMSTGIIGQHLPMPAVRNGIDAACEQITGDVSAFLRSADAICTTDASRKIASGTVATSEGDFQIAAMAKGAGMIAPNMATMLAILMTDAPLSPATADSLLKHITRQTFNRVSVDGHTSTNDTFLLLSSTGAARPELNPVDQQSFQNAATKISLDLAKMLVADGEGAKRCFVVHVSGARDDAEAETLARTVAASPLVKTAITGADPNWGRIVSAAGYAGIPIIPEKTSLTIQGTCVFRDGQPASHDAAACSKTMSESDEVTLELCVGDGDGAASFWSSDLTEAYVRFNSLYTT
ncbi:MAG: bifunctional glutamate N-acetyltransferase/amino-acid acetyltransferase ArgJ [Planctomycetota bacterium]